MIVLLVIVGIWNAIAVMIGILGLFRRESRPGLAKLANRQAAAALAISLVCWLLGILGSAFGPIGGAALVLAWLFWASGGLLPFTIAILLRASPRTHGES